MKRRIFVAIPIPEEIKMEVRTRQKRDADFAVRWIKPENLHITVVPPWYVAEDELTEVEKVLNKTVEKCVSFTTRFEKILFGPPGQPPRLIWAEGETPQEFVALKESLENALLGNPKTAFYKKEKRPAKLHLTIVRFRPGSIKKSPQLDGEIDWKFEAASIDLMESKLERSGAEYTALQTFQFL